MENKFQLVQSSRQKSAVIQTPLATYLSKNLLSIILSLIVVLGSIFIGIQIGKNQMYNQESTTRIQTTTNPTVLPTTNPAENWKIYINNIEDLTLSNNNFRKVIYTGQHVQLVLMSLLPNEDIGREVHDTTDQFLRIEKGEGKVIMNEEEYLLKDGSVIIVPAGTQHNIINTSSTEPMQLYTIYSPPHHKDGTIHKTKQEAETDTADHL